LAAFIINIAESDFRYTHGRLVTEDGAENLTPCYPGGLVVCE
jgi:hypothetical protein